MRWEIKEAHLVDAIEHLTEQNAILQTRLIASLDALSAVSNDALDKSKEDIEALRLLNQNLALRLHDAARENTELRECLDSYSEPCR